MSTLSTISVRPDRSSRADLVTVLVIGGLTAGFVLTNLVVALVAMFRGGAVSVEVWFDSIAVPLPGGAEVAVGTGQVTTSDLTPETSTYLVLSAVLPALATLVVIACVALVVLRVLWGHAFAAGTSHLIWVAAFAILGGWVADLVFGALASNGALAVVGAADEGIFFTVSGMPPLAALAVGAVAILLRSGERLRRDIEGLV